MRAARAARAFLAHPFAFAKGAAEFRLSATYHYASPSAAESYEWGRDTAHAATLRHFEDGGRAGYRLATSTPTREA